MKPKKSGIDSDKLLDYIMATPELKEDLEQDTLPHCDAEPSPEIEATLERLWMTAQKQAELNKKRKRVTYQFAAGVAACMVLFFTLTSPGRAWAKAIYHSAVNIFDNALHFQSEDKPEDYSGLYPFVMIESGRYNSLEEIYDLMGYELNYLSGDGLAIIYLDVVSEKMVLDIKAYYDINNDENIDLYYHQTLFESTSDWGSVVRLGEAGVPSSILPNGETMYWVVQDDGLIEGTAQWENYMISISSESLSQETMQSFLNNIK